MRSARGSAGEAGGSVRFMSVHKAKGLEFPVVVIADAARSRPAFKEPCCSWTNLELCSSRAERTPLCFELAKAEVSPVQKPKT